MAQPKQLTELEWHHIRSAINMSGSYDPDENMYYFEEELTVTQYNYIEAFLRWCHDTNTHFGSGTYQQVYHSYLQTL